MTQLPEPEAHVPVVMDLVRIIKYSLKVFWLESMNPSPGAML
jgi:hypothetical protein